MEVSADSKTRENSFQLKLRPEKFNIQKNFNMIIRHKIKFFETKYCQVLRTDKLSEHKFGTIEEFCREA